MSEISQAILDATHPTFNQYQSLYQASNPTEAWFVAAQSRDSQGLGVLLQPKAADLGSFVVGYTTALSREHAPTIVASNQLTDDPESIQVVAEQLNGNMDQAWSMLMKRMTKDITSNRLNAASAKTPLMEGLGNQAAKAYFGGAFPAPWRDPSKPNLTDAQVIKHTAERVAKQQTLSSKFNRLPDPENPKLVKQLVRRVKNKDIDKSEQHFLPAEYDWLNISQNTMQYQITDLKSIHGDTVELEADLIDDELGTIAKVNAETIRKTMNYYEKGTVHIGHFMRYDRTTSHGKSYVAATLDTYIGNDRHLFYIDSKFLERVAPEPKTFKDAYFAFRISGSKHIDSHTEGVSNIVHECRPVALQHPDALQHYYYGTNKRGAYIARLARANANTAQFRGLRSKRDDALLTVKTPLNQLFKEQ